MIIDTTLCVNCLAGMQYQELRVQELPDQVRQNPSTHPQT
jgi:hypothetical protein